MQVHVVQQWVLDRLNKAVSSHDEATTAQALDYSRALLVALATRASDETIALEKLAVGTHTASLILRMHVEYLREMLRRGVLPATKDDGEYQIKLVDLISHLERRAGIGRNCQQVVRSFRRWSWPL